MPRPRTIPRHTVEGVHYVELYRSPSLRELAVDSLPSREMLTAVVERFNENLDVAIKFFELDEGVRPLIKNSLDSDDFIWLVKETPWTSAQNKRLGAKCKRLESLVIERTNEYAEQLKEAYYVIPQGQRTRVPEEG